jgi:(2R)-ethylmalonyl-CoA mutase
VLEMGGAIAAVENAYMKQALVASHTRRLQAIETGDLKVVGVNLHPESAPSPLVAEGDSAILRVDDSAERRQIEKLRAFRSRRNEKQAADALRQLTEAVQQGTNVMGPSIRAAHAGVTTGEWTDCLRRIFGEYRAPTGVGGVVASHSSEGVEAVRARVTATSERLGRRLKILVGKPGLDGHSNGAEQIAVKARDVGMEVVYDGIRLTPEEIVQSARDEGVHVIGLSVLSGSHVLLAKTVIEELRKQGLEKLPLVVGGIVPEADAATLRAAGVQRVYTPKDFDLTRIMDEIVDLVNAAHG